MMNSLGLLDHAKEQVIILCAIKLRTEAARLLHYVAARRG